MKIPIKDVYCIYDQDASCIDCSCDFSPLRRMIHERSFNWPHSETVITELNSSYGEGPRSFHSEYEGQFTDYPFRFIK